MDCLDILCIQIQLQHQQADLSMMDTTAGIAMILSVYHDDRSRG